MHAWPRWELSQEHSLGALPSSGPQEGGGHSWDGPGPSDTCRSLEASKRRLLSLRPRGPGQGQGPTASQQSGIRKPGAQGPALPQPQALRPSGMPDRQMLHWAPRSVCLQDLHRSGCAGGGRGEQEGGGGRAGGPHSAELLPGAAHLCSDSSSPALRSLSQVLTFQWPVQEASCLRSQQQGPRPWGWGSCFCSS